MPPIREWYSLIINKADTAPTVAEVNIFGPIGRSWSDDSAVSAKQFLDELKALPASVKTIKVGVNSPGGDVFDAVAMANGLRRQSTEKGRTIAVSIEALAASAATIITSAGDTIKIAENGIMLVHDPRALVWGVAGDMRAMAEALDRVRASIIVTYQWVSKLSAEALGKLMRNETWMDASEALAHGFVTSIIIKSAPITACLSPEACKLLGDVPDRYKPKVAALLGAPGPHTTAVPASAPKAANVFDLYTAREQARLASIGGRR